MEVKLALIIFFTALSVLLRAQPAVTGYAEVGGSPVLETYGGGSLIPGYSYRGFNATAGISWLGSGQKETFLDAVRVQGSYTLAVKKKNDLSFAVGWLWKQPSHEMRETDLLLTAGYRIEHWHFLLGNNFRTYRMSKEYRGETEWPKDETRIREPWNLMYNVSFFLNRRDKIWNIMASVTNVDYFMIEQETNPLFVLKGDYKPVQHVDLFLEAWMKTAGMLNIQVNYYGTLIRLGVIWTI